MKPKIYLACTAENATEASKTGFKTAQMIYRGGAGGRLYRKKDAPDINSGLAVIDCRSAHHFESLAEEIADECRDRCFDGAVIEGSDEIAEKLIKRGLTVFTDEKSRLGIRLIGTAMSGGSLEERLKNEMKRGTAAAQLEVICMDFTIPEKRGTGRELAIDELRALMSRTGSSTFFSREMMCWYFNYRENGKRHFVLYDNADSILSKLKLARALGIEYAFLCYSEIRDIGVLERIK